MKKLALILFTLLATTTLSARIVINVNTYSTYDFNGKHFYVIPATSDISPKDAEFKEYANYVKAILRTAGAVEAEDPATAEVCILFDYLITDESYVETVPVPIRDVVGKVLTINHSQDHQHASASVENVYGTVGYTDKDVQVNRFRRIVNIYAYDNLDYEGDPDMLWKCNVVSEGSRNDLHYVLPGMLYCLIDQVGGRGNKEYTLNDEAEWGGYKAFQAAMKYYEGASFPFQAVEENTRINYIVLHNNTLTVTVRQRGPGKRVIAKNSFLRCDGVEYPIAAVEHAKLGGTNRFSKEEIAFYQLVFQNVPSDIKVFDIVSPGKFEWNGITIQ